MAPTQPMGTLRPVPREERTHSDLDDDELMMLTKAGHQDAFEALVQRHQALVYGLASRFLGDYAAGRDVAQDVFLALWVDRERFRSMGRFRSYLVSMTMHRCHSLLRRQKCHDRGTETLLAGQDAQPPPAAVLPLDGLLAHELARQIQQTVTELSEKQRQVVILRFTYDMDLIDISDAVGMPVNTVKSHLSRGLKRLEALLTRGDPG